jgi:putative hydrolase of the HAD superfamily
MLMILDLDNTLIDRDAAFREAAAAFLAGHRLPARDLAWMVAEDASGYTPRPALGDAIAHRYGEAVTPEATHTLLDSGVVDRVALAPPTAEALAAARRAGWRLAIATNGKGVKQLAKIRNARLEHLVDGWAVSEDVGVKKPDPRIFAAAAHAAGADLAGAWVIGDSPQADIAGAHALGLHSVWVGRGTWPGEPDARPTHVAENVAAAIRYVLAPGH